MSNSTPSPRRAAARPGIRLLGRRLANRRGAAALEFGVLATVLVPMMLIVFDVGNQIYQTLVLRQAIRAGALYALYYHDTAGIQRTIEASIPAGWTNASVFGSGWAPTTACICMSSQGTAAAASSCSCPTGDTLERLMTLTVTMPFSPMLLTSITQVGASDVIRYQ